MVNSMKSLHHI